ncbi:hypothetical protein GGR42_003133 [Saonia flava]|uniref:Uncharacterized protein n=1 Tax=Saonia flava TaxID=523696 RepID=A0A846R110_9FLAO|nr:hypothetical protein [Saonia flava]NJB72642.1 hypothetical protein [Saonia flava]
MAITGFEFINESELTGKVIIVNVEIVSKNLINFIAIFWLAKFLQLTSYKYLLYSLLFFSANHYGEIQRFVLLVTMLIMGVGLFKYGSKKVNLKFIIPGIFTLFFIGVFLFNTSGGESILERFYEASKIFTNREDNINDISTSIRISETEFAIERFKLHPLFGNGYARASEVDKIYGEDTYFHVSDIGLFGILYVFGIIGIIVIMGQLNLLIHFLKLRLKNYYQFTFVLSLFFMMVFTLLTGSSINGFSTFFFYISLMRLTYIPIKKSQISGF